MNFDYIEKAAVGVECYICSSGSWRTEHTKAVVKKITPAGQIIVSYKGFDREIERRFNKYGREIGGAGSAWRRASLSFDVAGIDASVSEIKLRDAAAKAVNAVGGEQVGRGCSKANLSERVQKLAALLDAARVAVEALPEDRS